MPRYDPYRTFKFQVVVNSDTSEAADDPLPTEQITMNYEKIQTSYYEFGADEFYWLPEVSDEVLV